MATMGPNWGCSECRVTEGLVIPCKKHSHTAPNRFDPYEALDAIEKVVLGLTAQDQVRALRAYITGMER